MRSRREGKKERKLKENRGDEIIERDWISIEWQAVLNSYLWRDAFNA